MDFDVIFIAGPQGSGKGTQGKKLADKLGFLFFGMGATLREIKEEHSPLAAQLSGVDGGTLLSDAVIIEILKDRLPRIPAGQKIIFDGVPRRLGQADFLVSYLRERGYKSIATIFLDLPREESVKRLLFRAKHEDRVDDTPEAIETRFKFYDVEMKPTLDYLRHETAFFDIDGSPSADEVEKGIYAALGIAS
jgi:adenylate kinase